MASMDGAKAVSLALRIVAVALSVAAAVVMSTATVESSGVVSYTNRSALVYFVAGSVISAVCSGWALYLFVQGGGSMAVSLLDAAAQAFLFSASGAALAARGCFAGGADAFSGRVGTAAAIGVCAAVAVLFAALTRNAPREGLSVVSRTGGGGASGGSACKHGC